MNNKNTEISPRLWVSVVVPIIAIIIAFLSFLNSAGLFKSNFNLDVYSNGVYLISGNDSAGRTDKLNFIIPVVFLNKGDKDGVLEEIYLRVNDGKEVLTHNVKYEVDPEKLIEEVGCIKTRIYKQPFSPFGIGGHEEQTRFFMFFPLMIQ